MRLLLSFLSSKPSFSSISSTFLSSWSSFSSLNDFFNSSKFYKYSSKLTELKLINLYKNKHSVEYILYTKYIIKTKDNNNKHNDIINLSVGLSE